MSQKEPHLTQVSLIQRLARVLLPAITATLTLQPLAYAAPNPSLLTQQPRFIDLSVDSNVAFIMDDSLSMEDIRLPVPAGLNAGESSGGNVNVRGRATAYGSDWTVTGPLTVDRNNEWVYRSATLNPLYYNPAITYRPWNDNGRAGASGNFPPSQYGVTAAITAANGFRVGVTPHDMRYVGPNYEYGSGNDLNRRLPAGTGINAGANPPAVPAYLTATRPAEGGFQGVTDTAATPRNQDLFTSPMVQANGGTQQCLVTPTPPTLTNPPSFARGSQPLPTSDRTTESRPNAPLPTQASTSSVRPSIVEPTQARTTTTRPIAVASYGATVTTVTGSALSSSPSTSSTRPSSARPADTNRALSTRPSTPQPSSDRTLSPRPSTAITTSARPTAAAVTEWRQESGVCGNWGGWSTTQPGPALCSDPNSEGGVRQAQTQSRTTCASGTLTGSQCLLACPAGTTVSGSNPNQCVSNCAGTVIGSQCYSACSTGSIYSSDPAQCVSNCPTGTTASGLQCLGSCGSGETLIGGQCYSACPANTTIASNATQCISTCPTGTTQTASQCLGQCPTGTTQSGNLCYSSCPGGTEVNPANVGQCLTVCPAGTTRSGSNPLQCLGTCAAGTTLIAGQCWNACPTGTRNPANPAQCLSCPTGGSVSGTQCVQTTCAAGSTLINGQCYGACPAGTAVVGTTSPGNTQCRTVCPAGFRAQTTTQCFLDCGGNPSYPNRVGGTSTTAGTCYANCPAGNDVNPSNAAQCLTQCGAGYTRSGSNPLICNGACGGSFPTLLSGACYGGCPAGSSLTGGPTSAQCISACPTGQTVNPSNVNQCVGTCPAGYPTLSGTTCYAACPPTFPTPNPSNAAQCLGDCPAGTTQAGSQCQACPAGSDLLPSGQCCPLGSSTAGNCPLNRPVGSSCAAGQWVPNLDVPAPARYYVFAPASPITNPTLVQLQAQQSDPANYVRVEINRDRLMSYPKASGRVCTGPDLNNDGLPDCLPNSGECTGSVCTWDEEAQNFANWFTYYRTRLSSAIAVTAESLSGLKRDSGLDNLRLAYGSINYFPNGANPFGAAGARLSDPMSIDGQSSNGALVRGVRPFTEVTPPSAPGSNDRRQEVFDWLFSLRAVASTPNREALDSVGRYFQRSDTRGPWIQPANPTSWTSTEDPRDHISCRRNYTIMITDGEWTRAPWVPAAPQQPLVENAGTPLNSLSTTGPTIAGLGSATYTYNPATEVQFSTNASPGGTLSDIAHYYWRTDLRPEPEMTNSLRPIPPTAGSQGNPAFWQHMTPYLIGYGISASLDNDGTRQTIAASATAPQAISWPSVRLESRPAEDPFTIVTDRDTAPINCNYDPASNASGCGRVDDTFRAGMAARGDFLAATDVGRLAQSIAAAFGRINEIEGTATSLTGRSGTIQSGDRLFAASFRTNVWTGRVQSYDAVAYFTALSSGNEPASVDSRFPAPASRNMLTSTAVSTAATLPTGAANFTDLSPAQRGDLSNDPALLQWLRGDQSVEVRNGGDFRNRPPSEIMGSIVNSQPVYSKATDQGYQPARRPAAAASSAPNSYRDFLNLNRSSRPARVYVGSNGGMLHAFDASGNPLTNANYMNEVFAYVPRAVYPQLSTLASPGYVHRYLVDGPVVEGDIYVGGAWRTVLVGTTGAGPKGVFALDITQRSGSTATAMGTGNVMWDVAGSDTATNIEHLGHILQPGVIGSGRDGNWYYFVGNGNESTNDKARLLAINLSDGSIHVVDTDNVGGPDPANANVDQRPNGLGGVTPVYDANRNVIAIYGGDRLGRMWKFDLSNNNRSGWGSTLLFTASNGAGERQPITAAPRVLPHPLGGRMVVFGTGKLYERNDTADNTVQSVYGVWEKNISSPTTVIKSTLRQFTLASQVASSGERFRQLNGTDTLNWATDNGWYFDLVTSAGNIGERVVASPSESFGFANVTTFEPTSQGDPCLGGGTSFFYRLDVAGSFTRSPFANQGAVSNLPSNVPLNTVVASELPGGTVSGVQMMLRGAAGTMNTSTSLSSTQFGALGSSSTSSPLTNPCLLMDPNTKGILNQPIKSATPNCPVAPLRVWRDLPRSQAR